MSFSFIIACQDTSEKLSTADKADALQRLLEEERHTSFAKVSRG